MTYPTKSLAALAVASILSFIGAGAAHASVAYDFKITYNGSAAAVDAASDPIVGTSLNPGDSYRLDIHTAGNDYWNVTAPPAASIYASLLVLSDGTRTSDVTTTFYLDGVQVAQDVDLGITQSFVHLGAQDFAFPIGLNFDQVVVDLNLLSTNAAFTQIQDTQSLLIFGGFYSDPSIVYVSNGTKVPEPTVLSLLGIGLAGLGIAKKRKAQK